jgi:predicted nucleic acid-binding protein
MRVFLDANILFSAAKSDGAIRKLVHLLLQRGHECWIDDYVAQEARRNLTAKYPDAVQAFEALLRQLRTSPVQTAPQPNPDLDWVSEKDRPVLAAAMRLRCDALVTGDRTHFGPGYGHVFGGVTVHSPRSLAEAVFAANPVKASNDPPGGKR